MGEIIFILGGARSGKSSFAESLAKESSDNVAYVATYVPCTTDDEMKERINHHQKSRPNFWKTYEEGYNIAPLLKNIDSEVIVIDCMTIYTSNLLLADKTEEEIKANIAQIIFSLKDVEYKAIIVANEVGLGVVPESPLGRKFRDIAGRVNQAIAKEADSVYFIATGIPLKIK